MSLWKAFVLVSLSICVFSYSLFANNELDADDKLERDFSLSSAYVERVFNSNEGLVEFPLAMIQAYSKLFDFSTQNFKDSLGARIATAILELPLSFWFAHSVFIPFHEFGHARAVKSFGVDYTYNSFGFGGLVSANMSSFWELSLWRLVTPPFFFPGSGMASTGYLGIPKANSKLVDYIGASGVGIVIASGGLNNQSLLAKKLAQKIYQNNGHISYFQHYLGNKISPFVYSQMDKNSNPTNDSNFSASSDIGAVLRGYTNKGYNINHGDIELQSLVSLISGTSFALLRGYYKYIANGSAVVQPLEFFGVRVPDINSYINARGLSFEIVSGYRWSKDLFFDIAYEFVWKGESTHQVTPSFNYNLASLLPSLNDFRIRGDIVFGKAMSGSIGADYAPFDVDSNKFFSRLAYFIDIRHYNALNLHGERNTPSYIGESTHGVDVFAGLRMRY